MLSITHGIISGGSFIQYKDQRRITSIYTTKNGLDLLREAVAPAAFHDSGERFDPPKCHPNTRVAVLKRLMKWVENHDSEDARSTMIWLYGAAGAGKTAIAQTIAERCYIAGRLLASFFFGRSDPNRNHARSVFPTIAYQIARVFPQIRDMISSAVEEDPLIFTRSLSTQFSILIVGPIQELARTGFFLDNVTCPRLIIIDGLDECLDRKAQGEILDVIIKASGLYHLPLIFLIASRPEHDISIRLELPDTHRILRRLFLDDSYLPDLDIHRFLRDKFYEIRETHPSRYYIPPLWPTEDVVRALVRKSSGQFIYASTIIKYVGSTRHDPRRRLDVIRNAQSVGDDSPFKELDALYRHIFSGVENITLVLRIIAFKALCREPYPVFATELEAILGLEPGSVSVLFCDLTSLVSLRRSKYSPHLETFELIHVSLLDYLMDDARSIQFHLDLRSERINILRHCAHYLTCDKQPKALDLALAVFIKFGKDSLDEIDLWIDLYSISIRQWYGWIDLSAGISAHNSICKINFWMIREFLEMFSDVRSDAAKQLRKHHFQSFYDILEEHLDVYYSDPCLTLLITLIDFVVSKRLETYCVFYPEFLLFQVTSDLLYIDCIRLGLLSYWPVWTRMPIEDQEHNDWGFISIVHRYLTAAHTPDRFRLSKARFAQAARTCLRYLSDGPWGPFKRVPKHCTEYQTLAHFYNDELDFESLVNFECQERKYSLAVEYFVYFLARAGHSDELVVSCQDATFTELTEYLPEVGGKVASAVLEYVAKARGSEHSDNIKRLQ